MKPLSEKLELAKIALGKRRPYIQAILYSLVPVETPAFGTLGVDQYFRLHYDPQAVDGMTVEELTAVLYHECQHLLRDHTHREPETCEDHTVWNIAADLEINDDLKEEKDMKAPDWALYPDKMGLRSNLSAEEYFELLQAQTRQQGQAGGRQSQNQSGQAGQEQTGQNQPEENPSSQSGGGGHGANQQGSRRPMQGGCGTCAAGARHSNDAPPNPDNPGMSAAEAEILRRATAQQIREHARANPGSVPANLQKWAEAYLEPKVPWQRVLRTALTKAIETRAGHQDYSYSRLKRNAPPGFIMPGMVRHIPEVAVVIDTSGSMTEKDCGQAEAEVAGLLKALRTSVRVLCVDVQVHSIKRVFDRRKISLFGGGGTSMDVGVKAALKLRPKPDIIVVITDGFTRWEMPAPDRPVIVVRTRRPGPGYPDPTWAKAVVEALVE